jgi:KUP system potassium uptake protein
VLIALGIIFGDIGTSPLYVLKAIVGEGKTIHAEFIYGGLSCIFWTLTIQTTLKYVFLTLKADNKGEGGIFSLYALVRVLRKKRVYLVAIIGGSALLADGIITPAISVTAAVEGFRVYNPNIQTLPIILTIIAGLFVVQQFGTRQIGSYFGPAMTVWFLMLAALGLPFILQEPEVLRAISPSYAYELLVHEPQGFWILGAVFLCTTGAEALYSDLGHCGRGNIRTAWVFVKTSLLINYFGQGAWLLQHANENLGQRNPFFMIMPEWWVVPGVIIATACTIIASQAMISGSFTLVSEAMRLNFWPKIRIEYPTVARGQLYVPTLNWLLMLGCIAVVLIFRESSNMEAAYGLSISATMLMTTFLLSYYLVLRRVPAIWIWGFLALYLVVEGSFLVANAVKFTHGGWFTVMIGSFLILIMLSFYKARKIKNMFTEFVGVGPWLPVLRDLSEDEKVPKYATNLVYLTSADLEGQLEEKIVYSIINKQPKRADLYWFIHVDVQNDPHTMEYVVTTLIPNHAYRIDFRLGFRVQPRINKLFHEVIDDMVENKEVDITSRYPSLERHNVTGDFRYVVIDRIINYEDFRLKWYERLVLGVYSFTKYFSISEQRAFGLDTSLVTVEHVPLSTVTPPEPRLKRRWP